ncbi:MAG: BLUF domain-containing protein [Verrucomicrobiota bacterium]
MRLCRLVYKSTTSWDILNNQVLAKLAESSYRNNAKNNISGLLILSDETFLQVLEGPDEAVNALYEKIVKSPLHHDVRLLSFQQIASRNFHDWSMRFVDLNDVPKSPRELFRKKYEDTEGYIHVPDDALCAIALLFDAQALCRAEGS